VPAPTRAPPPADGEMVAISQLDDWAQVCVGPVALESLLAILPWRVGYIALKYGALYH
jgi:hypothetical protein